MANLETVPNDMEPCKTQCSVCTGEQAAKYFIPVFHSMVTNFLQSALVSDAFPLPLLSETIVNLVWSRPDWKAAIFDKKGKTHARRYNVQCLFLSLIATQIIIWEQHDDNVYWVLNRTDTNQFCHEIDV